MSEVTVKAIQPILGLRDGDIVTIERTPRVDIAIKAGRLTIIGDVEANEDPAVADQPDPDVADDPAEPVAEASPRTKRVKKLAGAD